MAITEETGTASGLARHAERVAKLCSFAERRAGTDAERRAAAWIADQAPTAVGGARAAIEPTYVHPQWPAVGFAHCLLAIVGSLLAGVSPIAAFAIVFVAAVSFYLDLSGRWYLLRSLLFFRRASQNVVVPPLPQEPERPRVIVCAHYDAPLTGAAYNGWAVRAFARFSSLWPARTSPQAVAFWAIALLLPPLGLRLAGIDADWVSAAQLPQTFLLLLAAFMYGEIAPLPVPRRQRQRLRRRRRARRRRTAAREPTTGARGLAAVLRRRRDDARGSALVPARAPALVATR